MSNVKYQRVLLKLSGEAFCAPGGSGVDAAAMDAIAQQIVPVVRAGVQMGVVVGAGNFARGRALKETKLHPTTADYMGMLGTVMNALALRDTLQSAGVSATVLSAISMPLICEGYFRPRAMELLERGHVLIFAGGTSHPGVTTDMCAAIRSADIEADILLKATKVDGVYDGDPQTNPSAKKYDRLTHEKAITDRLGVMDIPAMAFCRERNLSILVFNMYQPGNLAAAVAGETLGTMVGEMETTK
ncbi:MAG: UMP kinase [Phycisphaerae bacterium]|nr:UMP kinase [Phycisphaerae bacterium]